MPSSLDRVQRIRVFSPLFDDHEKLLFCLGRGANEHVVVAGDEHDGAHRRAHVQQTYPLQDVVLNRLGSISTAGDCGTTSATAASSFIVM